MIGLLWQRDREDESLETTLAHACRRYRVRFGQWPAIALVAEETAPSGIVLTIDGKKRALDVRHTHRLRRGCVMVGVEGRGRAAAPPPLEITEEAEEPVATPVHEADPSDGEAPPVPPAVGEAPPGRRPRRGRQPVREEPVAPPAGEAEPAAGLALPVSTALPAPAQSQLPGIDPPALSPVKRRSTMGWAPSPGKPPEPPATDTAPRRSRRPAGRKDIEKD